MKILIVDDDAVFLTALCLSLEDVGFPDVTTAASGDDALALLEAGAAPEAIFCDLNMPGMDGVELIRHLARRQFGGGVVLLSGEDWRILKTCEELGQAFGLDMLGSLQKPCRPRELTDMLGRLQPRKTSASSRPDPIAPADLKAAIESGQIRAWLQPQFATQTLEITAVEALARWPHPARGLIPPMAFIPVAEEYGLIDALMAAVYRDAVAQMARLAREGFPLRVAINLSTDNLNRHDLPEQLEGWAREAGLTPRDVVIELTESRLSKNLALSLEILTRLRLKGFTLSIDDFGTGYSSLEQLHRMPFNELKIDRGFVHGATADSRSRAVFESSVELARKLRMSTVAEGVEDERDFLMARNLGVDLVQGYHFCKPLSPDALLDWLRAGQRAQAPSVS